MKMIKIAIPLVLGSLLSLPSSLFARPVIQDSGIQNDKTGMSPSNTPQKIEGTIVSLSGGVIALKTDNGPETLHLSNTADLRLDGKVVSIRDYSVGDHLVARGKQVGAQEWLIDSAIVFKHAQLGLEGPMGLAVGEVTAIKPPQLTFKDQRGVNQTIVVDEDTSLKKNGMSITMADIHVGDRVLVKGKSTNNGFMPALIMVRTQTPANDPKSNATDGKAHTPSGEKTAN